MVLHSWLIKLFDIHCSPTKTTTFLCKIVQTLTVRLVNCVIFPKVVENLLLFYNSNAFPMTVNVLTPHFSSLPSPVRLRSREGGSRHLRLLPHIPQTQADSAGR